MCWQIGHDCVVSGLHVFCQLCRSWAAVAETPEEATATAAHHLETGNWLTKEKQ